MEPGRSPAGATGGNQAQIERRPCQTADTSVGQARAMRYLSPEQVRRLYDRFGRMQHTGVLRGPALAALIRLPKPSAQRWPAPDAAPARTDDGRPNRVPGDIRSCQSRPASADSVGDRFWGQVRGFPGRLRALQDKGATRRETSQVAGKARRQALFQRHIADGKEGVGGSSPPEGLRKSPANGHTVLSVLARFRLFAGTRRVHFGTGGHSRARATEPRPWARSHRRIRALEREAPGRESAGTREPTMGDPRTATPVPRLALSPATQQRPGVPKPRISD